MDVVLHRRIFYAISGMLVLAGMAAIAIWGLKPGIDFTGGSLLEVEFALARPAIAEVHRRLAPLGLGEIRLQPTDERRLIIRSRHLTEAEHQLALAALDAIGGGAAERRFNAIGPAIGRELARRSLAAILLAILFIVSYIAWAFRGVRRSASPGRPAGPASWQYGFVTVAALAHDILIPTGFFALAGRLYGVEVDTLFVTALLTILGFSVHDTIVVFDRIRENLARAGREAEFGPLVSASIRQTFVRSVNTSLTVLLALLAVAGFGGAATRLFSVTLLIGIIAGTYSSICIASPLLVTWHQWSVKRKA